MAYFFAQTSKGLVDVLHDELTALGIKRMKKQAGGVAFESNWEMAYLVHLKVRSITRVLLPVLDFSAYDGEGLYHHILKHDFTKYIKPNQTLAVYSKVQDSSMRDQRFVSLKVKDAIVDQFRDKFGIRPDVDKDNADLQVHVRVKKNLVSVAIDLTGESLSNRGYRQETGEAPLREHIAASLIKLSGWTPDVPLMDPMCGSGTMLIEAARMGQGRIASLPRSFCFQQFTNFSRGPWKDLVREVEKEETDIALKIYGADRDPGMIQIAKYNAKKAGVMLNFQTEEIAKLKRPTEENGILVVNPPYGDRLLEIDEAKEVYRELGDAFKREFKGWTCWVLSGNEELSREVRLRASLRVPVWNGPIECRFLKYEIN